MKRIQLKATLLSSETCLVETLLQTHKYEEFSDERPAIIGIGRWRHIFGYSTFYTGYRVFLGTLRSNCFGKFRPGNVDDSGGAYYMFFLPEVGSAGVKVPSAAWPAIQKLVLAYNDFYKE